MIELVQQAVAKGARLYSSVSGGKDGQAMTKTLFNYGLPVAGLVHADLGKVEWPQSLSMCENLSAEFNAPLHVVRRTDGRGLFEHWEARKDKLAGTGKPFWSSSKNRYCTSDLKRDVIDMFYRNCGSDFIISCEGLRAQESPARAKKIPFEIRDRITSSFYDGMTVEEAIENYTPGKRLALTWYPIFNFSIADVWATYGMEETDLVYAQEGYAQDNIIPEWWPFHPAYVFGNERVSCMFCILGSINDLRTAAQHNPELLADMIQLEEEGNATFKNKFSLKQLL